MSTFNIKSVVIRDREASPPLKNNPEVSQGLLKGVVGIEKNTAAIVDAGTQFRLVSVPSNARLQSLEYTKETTGTTVLDIAVWYPNQLPQGAENSVAASSESALISSSTFVSNISGVDGGTGFTNGFGAATTPSVGALGQPLWQMLGLSTDPHVDLDLGFTVRTATAEAGYVGLRASYID